MIVKEFSNSVGVRLVPVPCVLDFSSLCGMLDQ